MHMKDLEHRLLVAASSAAGAIPALQQAHVISSRAAQIAGFTVFAIVWLLHRADAADSANSSHIASLVDSVGKLTGHPDDKGGEK